MRQVYRIDLTGSYHLKGLLRCEAMPNLEGKLMDISAKGVGLAFTSEADPRLLVGAGLELVFRAPNGTELKAAAVVRDYVDPGGFVRYGFEFEDPEELDKRIPILLRPIFNRRRAPRVKPEAPISVQIEHAESSTTAELVDISTIGASVTLPFGQAEAFDRDSEVSLSFLLPTCTTLLTIAGLVRGRRLVGPTVHVGIEFDSLRTEGLADVESALQDFVASREVSSTFAH